MVNSYEPNYHPNHNRQLFIRKFRRFVDGASTFEQRWRKVYPLRRRFVDDR